LLLRHLTQRIEQIDNELVHTDRRALQHSIAHEVQELRALTDRIRSVGERDETISDIV
jgi:hypothetical protein